jgi:hypothetical protein
MMQTQLALISTIHRKINMLFDYPAQSRFTWLMNLLACVLLLLVGCSPSDVGYVHGKVTIQGTPLPHGSVVFEDTKRGIAVFAPLKPDGTYTALTYDKAGLPAGKYAVTITSNIIGTGENPLVARPAPPPPPVGPPIPEKYTDAKTSGLTVQVQPGENKPFDFDLK